MAAEDEAVSAKANPNGRQVEAILVEAEVEAILVEAVAVVEASPIVSGVVATGVNRGEASVEVEENSTSFVASVEVEESSSSVVAFVEFEVNRVWVGNS